MNITLYPLGAYTSGYCLPFTIELDGLDQEEYGQAINKGLFEADYKKGDGNVLSSRCLECDHVVIGSVEKVQFQSPPIIVGRLPRLLTAALSLAKKPGL